MVFAKKKEDKLDKQVLAEPTTEVNPQLELDKTAYTIVQQADGHWAVVRVRFNLDEVERIELEKTDLKEHAVERLKIILGREVL